MAKFFQKDIFFIYAANWVPWLIFHFLFIQLRFYYLKVDSK